DYTESVATFLHTGNMVVKNVTAAKKIISVKTPFTITIKSLSASRICQSIAKLGEEMRYNVASLGRAPTLSYLNHSISTEVTLLKDHSSNSAAEGTGVESDFIGKIVDGLFKSVLNESTLQDDKFSIPDFSLPKRKTSQYEFYPWKAAPSVQRHLSTVSQTISHSSILLDSAPFVHCINDSNKHATAAAAAAAAKQNP
ncbi:hypothetical protein PFISCL1PPCAC_20843, partial [Pristionchus fissidentatus]